MEEKEKIYLCTVTDDARTLLVYTCSLYKKYWSEPRKHDRKIRHRAATANKLVYVCSLVVVHRTYSNIAASPVSNLI